MKPNGHSMKYLCMSGMSASERDKDLNGPSIPMVGPFEQTLDD